MSAIHCPLLQRFLYLPLIFLNWETIHLGGTIQYFHVGEESNEKMFGEINKRPYIKCISTSCIILTNMFSRPSN